MAKVARVKHIITIDGKKFSLRANDIYKDLEGVTGVTKAPATDTTVYEDVIKSHHFASGVVLRLKARAVSGTGTSAKYKDFTIITTPAKEKAAIAGLESKKITTAGTTWDILGARVPQRRRFS